MREQTPELQVARLLEMLETAAMSRGNRRPVLCVGRDGVTLREYRYRFFEHASVGTITVYDRSGKRLGTVYLGLAPELGQGQMTQRLTWLVREVLRRGEGPLPRLAYVTDAGDAETKYYYQVLRKMSSSVPPANGCLGNGSWTSITPRNGFGRWPNRSSAARALRGVRGRDGCAGS